MFQASTLFRLYYLTLLVIGCAPAGFASLGCPSLHPRLWQGSKAALQCGRDVLSQLCRFDPPAISHARRLLIAAESTSNGRCVWVVPARCSPGRGHSRPLPAMSA